MHEQIMNAPKGLAGVVVTRTGISDVRSEGELILRGYPISELVNLPFTEVAGLVVCGVIGNQLDAMLAESANLTLLEQELVLALPRRLHPMRMLQGMVPLIGQSPAWGHGRLDQGIHIAAKLPALVATHLNGEPTTLDTELDYVTRFLTAIETVPEPLTCSAFNTAQILQLEHSLNAGTFAARVVASTLADVECAIAAGIGALSGPLHGGADQAALELVDGFRDEADIRAYVGEALASGTRVPGMGHREYRVRDPRAYYLEDFARQLSGNTAHAETFTRLNVLERCFREAMAERGKEVHANVEFYKGLVYRLLGLPDEFFTSGFAMARVFGYIAHFAENAADNRIFRPAAEYVGP